VEAARVGEKEEGNGCKRWNKGGEARGIIMKVGGEERDVEGNGKGRRNVEKWGLAMGEV